MPTAHFTILDIYPDKFRVNGAGCWLWTGSDSAGYGDIRLTGFREYAHRLSWRIVNGAIPPAMQICHTCDTPKCCNPDHLFLGTFADNMRDMVKKRRTGNLRMTRAQVLEIRASAGNGPMAPGVTAQFMERFGFCRTSIQKAAYGRYHQHVTPENSQ